MSYDEEAELRRQNEQLEREIEESGRVIAALEAEIRMLRMQANGTNNARPNFSTGEGIAPLTECTVGGSVIDGRPHETLTLRFHEPLHQYDSDLKTLLKGRTRRLEASCKGRILRYGLNGPVRLQEPVAILSTSGRIQVVSIDNPVCAVAFTYPLLEP